MLREVMDYYGMHRDFRHAGYFVTEAQQQLATALKAAISNSRQGENPSNHHDISIGFS